LLPREGGCREGPEVIPNEFISIGIAGQCCSKRLLFALRTLWLYAFARNHGLRSVQIVFKIASMAFVGVNEAFEATATTHNPTRRR
jgi:hypothetical protein